MIILEFWELERHDGEIRPGGRAGMVPPIRFALKEMKGGRSGVSLRAAIGGFFEDGGAPRKGSRLHLKHKKSKRDF